MNSLVNAIKNTVPITQFNRGLAGKIFEDVKKQGAKVVMKNNTPECVLMSPEEYLSLMEEVEDAKLLRLAESRLQNFTPAEQFRQRMSTSWPKNVPQKIIYNQGSISARQCVGSEDK